jgi:hypothetical protein
LIRGEWFNSLRAIYQAIAVAIFSSDLGQGARRATRRKQRGLSSDQGRGESDQKPITVISQVNDRRFFRKQISKGFHIGKKSAIGYRVAVLPSQHSVSVVEAEQRGGVHRATCCYFVRCFSID